MSCNNPLDEAPAVCNSCGYTFKHGFIGMDMEDFRAHKETHINDPLDFSISEDEENDEAETP